MPHQVVVDGTLSAAQQGVVDLQVLGPRHAEDGTNALGLEALDQDVSTLQRSFLSDSPLG